MNLKFDIRGLDMSHHIIINVLMLLIFFYCVKYKTNYGSSKQLFILVSQESKYDSASQISKLEMFFLQNFFLPKWKISNEKIILGDTAI